MLVLKGGRWGLIAQNCNVLMLMQKSIEKGWWLGYH